MKYIAQQTVVFEKWFESLKDKTAKALIQSRVWRLEAGNFGDAKQVGDGVSEMRLHYGPGYRIYFGRQGEFVVLLLCGGTKDKQDADIWMAKKLLKEVKGNAS